MTDKVVTRSPGRLIVFEGIDGAGTTTQVSRMRDTLEKRGISARGLAQPSTGSVGRMIRQVLQGHTWHADGKSPDGDVMALLFAADRQDQQATEIGPLLQKGVHVVCDRYYYSSVIYQGVQIGLPDATKWVKCINSRIRVPDVTIYLSLDANTAEKRRRQRNETEEIFDKTAFQRRLVERYEQMTILFPDDPIVVIDGRLPIDDISRLAWDVVCPLLEE